MKFDKKVGVIIPSFNQGKYLEATIKSVVMNQKHFPIEIAVADGGSSDNSMEIIKKYESVLTAWCSEPDSGQANAINKGIEMLSDCDYYLWLNSDDIYESELSVKKIIEFAYLNHFEVCYGLSHFISEHGEIIGEYPVEAYQYKKLGNRCFLSQPSVMFSRKAYLSVGPINEKLKMCLDYEYWIRLAQKYDFGFVREYIGATRLYGETKTATMQKQHIKEAIEILFQYYGDIPMHWITTKWLVEHPRNIISHLPNRLLYILLRPYKKAYINQMLEGKSDV